MKVHTTQSLILGAEKNENQSTLSMPAKDFRLSKSVMPDYYSPNFMGREQAATNGMKFVLSNIKSGIKEVSKEAMPKEKRGDKFLKSPFFNTLLKVADYEVAVQAAISFVICVFLRPITIMLMAMANKKDKQDNAYASAHSMSSGVAGLISSIIISNPFKYASSHAIKTLIRNFDKDALKRLFPHLDINSIESVGGIRKPVKWWKDVNGNDFIRDLKDVQKLPVFTHLSEASEGTFSKVLGVNVDWAANKGLSFNDAITKEGEKFYDVVKMDNLGIVLVNKKGEQCAQVLLPDMHRSFVERLIRDSEGYAEDHTGSFWKDLDINSVFDKADNVIDFRKWKKKDGSAFKLDLDTMSVASPLETYDYMPRISGETWVVDATKGKEKFYTTIKNGVKANDKDLYESRGTKITKEMLDAGARFEIHDKFLTWGPDIITRPIVASGTIALIPWVLKNVFHLEKGKKSKEVQQDNKPVVEEKSNIVPINSAVPVEETKEDQVVAFKGSKPEKAGFLTKWLAKAYGQRLYESENLNNFAGSLLKMPNSKAMTQHMSALGSFVTSSVYVQQTLTKKELDTQRRRTLAINQILCFIIPTAAAYWVDGRLKNFTKNQIEYRYGGIQEQAHAQAWLEGKATTGVVEDLGKRLKGVRILAGLMTFTLIYRYATPVLITPFANWLGRHFWAKPDDKESSNQPQLQAEAKRA